jgi:NAD(P)-dependent dehydrogenase (short-subunit alcohol dehydrogenase family)
MSMPTTYFLTGCGSGIGRHLALSLLRRGHKVYATDVNEAALESLAAEPDWPADRAWTRTLSVTDPAAWEEVFAHAVETMGPIDVVMNIAGVMASAWAHETAIEDVHRQIDINLKGVIFGTQVAVHHMKPRGSGHVVNIASMAGIAPLPGLAVYAASKFGVRAFSVTTAMELHGTGVMVSTVCPDAVKTPLINIAPSESSAVIWSAPRLLTVEDLERLIIDKVLVRRPFVAALPGYRAFLSRIADRWPGLGVRLLPLFRSIGLKNKQKLDAAEPGGKA